METLSLLIADGSDVLYAALMPSLQSTFRIRQCRDGREALKLLQAEPPDIFVLDLMLPELDGLSLLHQAQQLGIRPNTLAVAPFASEYIVESAARLGVTYMMLRPCNFRAMVERINDIADHLSRPRDSGPDLRTHVSNMLISLGVSTKHHGYAYLREAILLMAQAPLQSVTKELYPAVAQLCGSTDLHVERSTRNAIKRAWECGDRQVWLHYFPSGTGGILRRPSNAVFISRLADRLNLDQVEIPLP